MRGHHQRQNKRAGKQAQRQDSDYRHKAAMAIAVTSGGLFMTMLSYVTMILWFLQK